MTAATLILLAAFSAQPETKPAQPQPAPSEPAQPAPAKPAQPEPSLDDLLGLPKAKPADKPTQPATPSTPSDKPATEPTTTPPAPVDPSKAELERQLSLKELGDLFDQAVEGMDQSAVRLAAKDTGIDTQRTQEDVIRKLDTLLEQAKKQQKKSKSKSKQQQQQQDQQDQQQQQQQQQSSQRNPGQSSDSNNQADGPSRQDGPGRAAPGGTAAWGNLPEHVRDALSQGKDDRYSSLYRSLTEKYYKRLAEEPKPGDLPAPAPQTPNQ